MTTEFYRPVKIDRIEGNRLQQVIAASSDECAALAKRYGIQALNALEADVVVVRQSDRVTYHVTGNFRAKITQECVVTGNDVVSDMAEDFEAWFTDQERIASFSKAKERRERENESDDEYEMCDEKDDPESIQGGMIDIGEVVAQFLALAINPYPHAAGVQSGDHIEIADDEKPNPFAAALASLKDKK